MLSPARRAVLAACLFVLLAAPASAAPPGCADAGLMPDAAALDRVRAATACLIDRERAARGLPAVSDSAALRGAAERYAREMVQRRFFAHRSPRGSTTAQRIRSSGYFRGAGEWAVGEALAWGSGERATPAAVVRAWLGSPGHRRILLARRYRELGLGVALGAPVAVGAQPAATFVAEYGVRR